MTIDPLSFLEADQNEQLSENNDPLSFLDVPKNKISQKDYNQSFEKFLKKDQPLKGRQLGADILTTGTALAGLPGDVASLFIGENPLTSEKLREKSFEIFPSLGPQNEEEKAWDEGLSTIMGLAAPTGPIKAAGKILGKGITKATPFLKGKYRELYEIGKNLGISEKFLTPFKTGKVSETFLKHAAKLGKEAKESIQFAKRSVEPMYEKLFSEGSKIPVNEISRRGVIRGLNQIARKIQKSPGLVEESKGVVKFLKETVENIEKNPNLTVENLMALQKEMGQLPGWGSLKKARKSYLINDARNAVVNGIYGMSPSLGEKFSNMDKLYAGYEKLAKEVSPTKLIDFASKGGPFGYLILSLISGKDISDSITNAAEIYFGKKAIGKISGKLLTDPKWNGIKEKILDVIKKESYDKIPKILVALKKKSQKEKIEQSKYEFD